jgi:hypothetical protein
MMRVATMLLALALVAVATPAVHAACLTDTTVEAFFAGEVRVWRSMTAHLLSRTSCRSITVR